MGAHEHITFGALIPQWSTQTFPKVTTDGIVPAVNFAKCVEQLVSTLNKADKHQQNPPPKPPPSFMSPLIVHLQNTLPVEFQLPDEIRTFFKSGK